MKSCSDSEGKQDIPQHNESNPEFINQLSAYADDRRKHYQSSSASKPKDSAAAVISYHNRQSPHRYTALANTEERRGGSAICVGCCRISESSVKLCTLPIFGGIPLHIHYLWPVFVLLSSLTALSISPLYALFSLCLGGPVLFGSVLIHELGHSVMAIYLGGHVSMILLWPLGGLAYISMFGVESPRNDILVAIAGPLTHLPQVLFWVLLMWLSNRGVVRMQWELSWGYNFWISLCAGAICVQVALFLFNLIPAFPLDGGRILGAVLVLKKIERNHAYQIAAVVGGIIGWIMLLNSFGAVFHNHSSFFFGWNTLFLAVYILNNCWNLWMLGVTGQASSHPEYLPAVDADLEEVPLPVDARGYRHGQYESL